MNSLTIAGSLGRDCEVRYLDNGDPVCSFSVADSMGRDKPTIWWNCSMFGKRAVALSEYLKKGQAVTVTGTVTEREWTDKDGGKRKSMDVRVNDVALQGGKREAAPAPASTGRVKSREAYGFDDVKTPQPFDDSDPIPF